MGNLTKDINRLCEEIQGLRAGRQELRKELAAGTKARQVEVLETCAAFGDARAWKAEVAHNSRQNFIDNLRQVVAEQEKSVRDDISTARRAWSRLRQG